MGSSWGSTLLIITLIEGVGGFTLLMTNSGLVTRRLRGQPLPAAG